jgi:hypothetical protein
MLRKLSTIMRPGAPQTPEYEDRRDNNRYPDRTEVDRHKQLVPRQSALVGANNRREARRTKNHRERGRCPIPVRAIQRAPVHSGLRARRKSACRLRRSSSHLLLNRHGPNRRPILPLGGTGLAAAKFKLPAPLRSNASFAASGSPVGCNFAIRLFSRITPRQCGAAHALKPNNSSLQPMSLKINKNKELYC